MKTILKELKASMNRQPWAWLSLALILVSLVCISVSGCKASLDKSGVYSQPGGGGMFLFSMDKALVDSKDTLNAFVTWEYQHHAQVAAQLPAVVEAADSIRANAPAWFADALALRTAYISVGSIVNSNALYSQVQLLKTTALTSGPLTNNIK